MSAALTAFAAELQKLAEQFSNIVDSTMMESTVLTMQQWTGEVRRVWACLHGMLIEIHHDLLHQVTHVPEGLARVPATPVKDAQEHLTARNQHGPPNRG